ncbi:MULTISPECIES: ABC transporter permease [Aeromonas]|uniref:Arginine ABC transporter permease protein ArtM n=1 Tax=Aeromonas sanarellii TaxID=633415 RepID=A0ABS4B0H0_9GAMM|nr:MULTISPECIES: ABC transporter permease [Aeromonas]MBP0600977.1 ABC transporter permease [Aeromonas sanarellii]MCO4204473.1 ABC transporter permease [Aeromonas taiwanensis]MEB6606138.1 ABC transporter permease [Aeromonas sanarellii]QXC29013.1 ABC transporter permease [Aeromonas sp. FDAARGOS 1409]QXW31129.1 ABC transporter permease [Aeromonas sanarellii]
MDFSIILTEWPTYWEGFYTTIWLVAASLMLGLLLAVPMGILRNSRNWLIKGPIWAYIYFFRGTPLLVQLFIIYYGAAQWEWLKNSAAWSLFSEAWFCALLAFTLNTGAYTAEIVRGAVMNMPKGQIEAASAFGMTRWQTLTRIILPNSFRRALPAYSNEVIFMLQGSAVAGIITIVDLTGAARIINSRYYSPFEAFLTAGLLYMLLTFAIVWLFKKWEARWHAHLRPRSV